MIAPDPALPWPINAAGLELITASETCRLRAYKCPAGVWTCGWGAADSIVPGAVWTQAQADRRLCDDLTLRVAQVLAVCREHAAPNQLAALVSLAYNIGPASFATSSVLKAHNRADHAAAARAFGLFNRARVAGRLTVLPGLTTRRASEAALYLQPEADAPPAPIAQAVAAEPALPASPTIQASTVATGFGVVGVLSQVGDQLGPVGQVLTTAKGIAVDTLGIPPHIAPWALLAGVGAIVAWRRWGQRRDGVA